MIIVWHRKDLRIQDNPALWHAVKSGEKILPAFIYDESLEKLGDSSKWWLVQSIKSLQAEYKKKGVTLLVLKGKSEELLLKLTRREKPSGIYWNNRYEKSYRTLDKKLVSKLSKLDIEGKGFDEEALCHPEQIFNKQGKPFSIYKAYWNTLTRGLKVNTLSEIKGKIPSSRSEVFSQSIEKFFPKSFINKKDYLKKHWKPGMEGARKQLSSFLRSGFSKYGKGRDFPNLDVTSRLSAHIHFGEISLKMVWAAVMKKPSSVNRTTFLQELAWREFAYYLLYHHPDIDRKNFDKKFDHIPWESNASFQKKWKEGKTGYPIVDAGIRQLNQTGWMHNRVRMIVASFLIKDGLITWRKGADFFWEELVDADLANNSLGWQWSAGSGPNANPFFRVFNPFLQGEKFDPKGNYIRKYVPELALLGDRWIHKPWEAPKEVLQKAKVMLGKSYPKRVIDHEAARDRAMKVFKSL